MKTNNKITPEGTRDILFSECRARRRLETQICRGFFRAGYNEVRTPVVEFYDVFNLGADSIPQEQMYKLTDSKGRLLVIRPDSTPPIARLYATRLQKATLPMRIYYSQPTVMMCQSMRGRSDQTYQAGIELIGASGKRADMEVLSLAIESLRECGADFRFEIGHAGIFKALCEQLPLSSDEIEVIREHIELKNYAALSETLDAIEDCPAAKAVSRLPRLFGGIEVLDEAASLFDSSEALSILDYLRDIYNLLSQSGLGDRLLIDLSLVHHNEYYTGIVFSGYAHGSGETIITGGRYDNLLSRFGADASAIGFGINIDALAQSVGAARSADVTVPDILIHAQEDCIYDAVRYANKLRSQGVVCELSIFDNADDARAYAAQRNIAKVEIITQAGVEQ